MHKLFNAKQQIYNSVDKRDVLIETFEPGYSTSTCTKSLFQSPGKFSTTFQTPRLDKTGSSTKIDFNFYRSRSNVYHNSRESQHAQSQNPSYRSIGVTRFDSPQSNREYDNEESRSTNYNYSSSQQIFQNTLKENQYLGVKQNKVKKGNYEYFKYNCRNISNQNIQLSSNIFKNKQMTKLNHLLTNIKQINGLISPLTTQSERKQNFYQTSSSKGSSNINSLDKVANSQIINNLFNEQDHVIKSRLAFQDFKKVECIKDKNIRLIAKYHKRSVSNPQEESIQKLENSQKQISNLTFRDSNVYQLKQFQASKPRPIFWKRLFEFHKIKQSKQFQTLRDDAVLVINSLKTEEEILHFLKNSKNFQFEKKRKVYSILDQFSQTNKSSLFQQEIQKNQRDFRNTSNFDQSLSRSNSKAESTFSKKNEESKNQNEKIIEKKLEIQFPLLDELSQKSGRCKNLNQQIEDEVSKVIEENKKKNLVTDEQVKKQEEDFQMSKQPITAELLENILQEIPKKKPSLLYFNKQQLLKLNISSSFNQTAKKDYFYSQRSKKDSSLNLKINSYQNTKCSNEEKAFLDKLFTPQQPQKTPDKNQKNYLEINKNKYQDISQDINNAFPNLVAHNIPKIEKKTGLTRQQLHLMFSKFKSLLHYKYLYNNNKMQTSRETVQKGFDINIFKKGIPKLNIAPDHAVEKLFYDKNKNSDNTNLLWEQFLSALIILESSSEDSKIDLFLRIIDSNQNGYLSFEEIFNASREVFKQILCENEQDKFSKNKNTQKKEENKNKQYDQKTRSQLIETYKISGDKFNYLEMSEFLTRYIFDYLDCPYDQEINTQLVRSKLSDQSKELDLLLMICFQDINQQPREEYDNQSDEEDLKQRKEEEKSKINQQVNKIQNKNS